MGVDRLNRQEFVERIGFDRRDGIDRGIVDKKIKTARRRDERLAVAFESGQVAEIAGDENGAPGSKPLVQGLLLFAAPSDVGRSCRNTRHPLRARLSQIAEPMPPAPPVTSALLPSNAFHRQRHILPSLRRQSCSLQIGAKVSTPIGDRSIL